MTLPTATITLTYDPGGAGESALTLAAPGSGYAPSEERAQALGRTADGTYYAYDRETQTHRLRLDLVLTNTQRGNLVTWFQTKVKGALYTFTLQDHLGNTFLACRLVQTTLPFTKTPGGRYCVTLEIVTPSAAE